MSNIEKNSVELFQKFLNFAKMSVNHKVTGKNNGKKYTTEQIIKALENPLANYDLLQNVSVYLLNNSMTYKRLISNFANQVNYDVVLIPSPNFILEKNKTKEDYYEKYYESAMLIQKINPKFNFKWISENIWIKGEIYLYKIEDSKGIIYQKIPEKICRISSVVDNVNKYSINLSALNDKVLYSIMPDEIKKLYDKYKEGKIRQDLLIDKKWYELSENNAIAFNGSDINSVKGFPLLSAVFPALNTLEELNKQVTDDEKVDNLKIIHMQYEVDEEGSSIIDPDLIRAFHESLKENLPTGTAVATNPLKPTAITTNSNKQSTNYREEVANIVYNSVGSSKELFNGQKNSNMAIEMSIKSDEVFALSVIGMFENYLNYELQSNKKTSYFIAKILPTTYYNINEYKRQVETSLSLSGNANRLKYLACCGYTPLEALSMLHFENEMELNELFTPALNGYNSSNVENGRPSNKDEGDVPEQE